MMNIYMMQYNYGSRYLVVRNENTYVVSVYKYEKYNIDRPFLSFRVKNIFLGKSMICSMTEVSGALNNSHFDGNTILLECEDSKYVYISALEIFEFRTEDKILEYISLMENNMIPYTFAIGEKYTYFISTHYKFIENDNIEEGTLSIPSSDNLDPCDYHLSRNGLDCFKKLLECNGIHSSWLSMESGDMEEIVEDEEDVEEDVNIHEIEYTDGSNKVVKIFNQKCVICLERDSDYVFKQCGHQCICEACFPNKGDIDILKCVFLLLKCV